MPHVLDILAGLKPWIPAGGLVNVLALAGGVGVTITLAAYGYWLREKGWNTPGHMRVMRIDNSVAYLITGVFVLATLIVGAELLYSAQIAVEEGDRGLLDLSHVLADRYGDWSGKFFLVGFFSGRATPTPRPTRWASLPCAACVNRWHASFTSSSSTALRGVGRSNCGGGFDTSSVHEPFADVEADLHFR